MHHPGIARRTTPGAFGEMSRMRPGPMIEPLIDISALGCAVLLGLLSAYVLVTRLWPRASASSVSTPRLVTALLGGLAAVQVVVGAAHWLWRGSHAVPSGTLLASQAALALAAAALTIALAGPRVEVAPIPAPEPEGDESTLALTSSPSSGEPEPRFSPPDSLPPRLPTTPLASLLLSSADSSLEPMRTAEHEDFDARLMHANRMQSIGRLAGGIAHDFNNLLTSILTSAELAQEALPAEHGVTPDLEEIRRAGSRASELTRQLLAFARRDVTRPRVLDANSLVGNLAMMLRRVLGETISLRFSLGTDLPRVYADPAQLEQVIVNLAVNARDAMPGGGELQLRTLRGIGGHHAGGIGVVLEVQDSGVGMDDEVQRHLFDPFFTTKTAGRGTGLGLATCLSIVSAHGGEITVSSLVGHGTTFRVWLPATEQPDDVRPALPSDTGHGSSPGGPQSILFVEDDDDVRSSTARALRRAGYHVLEAVDGADAVEQLAAHGVPVDLVVTDVVMPHMGGAELVRRLRMRWPDVHVLFTSGYPGDSPDVREIELMGMQVLEKPYTPTILLFEVRLRLDASRSG